MAGGAESSGSTGEGQKEISAKARTADARGPHSEGCRSQGVGARNTVTKQSHGLDEALWDHQALFVRS